MQLDHGLLRSKVGRRIFMLFILCALVPIAALAIVSFTLVTGHMKEQLEAHLREEAKAIGMGTMERLEFAAGTIKGIASQFNRETVSTFRSQSEGLKVELENRFINLAIFSDGNEVFTLLGEMDEVPQFSLRETEHLSSGMTLITTRSKPNQEMGIFMIRALDPQHLSQGTIVGEIHPPYLWNAGNLFPDADLCVLSESRNVLYCSLPVPDSLLERAKDGMIRSVSGQFRLRSEDESYYAGYWSLFLMPTYQTPAWTVILMEPEALALAPMANFRTIFPPVILLSLGVVSLLSLNHIRRGLVPLRKLQAGTNKIAQGEFGCTVTVTSGDEFQELSESFNRMAVRLDQQFDTLRIRNKMDRAILGSLNTERIIETVMTKMRNILPCDHLSLTLVDPKNLSETCSYLEDPAPDGSGYRQITTSLAQTDVEEISANLEGFAIDGSEGRPSYLADPCKVGMKSFLILPISVKGRLTGFVSMGYRALSSPSQLEELGRARQVVDQLAVGLSNARLVEELDQFCAGTLTALARAVDAKSPWTAGHSERVTKMAMEIGRKLGLDPIELQLLYRGGLVHDIGKIGVPPEILDKPGRLTDEELPLMREHVLMGGRILEPIAALADALPIVMQHHEWYDGSGYPAGLAGDEISFYARIFAVADCYDALATERPYRASIPRDRVIEMIQQGSGHQYDPMVVQAFCSVMEQKNRDSIHMKVEIT